jgi:plasmid stability protein
MGNCRVLSPQVERLTSENTSTDQRLQASDGPSRAQFATRSATQFDLGKQPLTAEACRPPEGPSVPAGYVTESIRIAANSGPGTPHQDPGHAGRQIAGCAQAAAAGPAAPGENTRCALWRHWRQSGAMPSVQIKDVPERTHAVLRQRAAAAHQSLQAYLRARSTVGHGGKWPVGVRGQHAAAAATARWLPWRIPQRGSKPAMAREPAAPRRQGHRTFCRSTRRLIHYIDAVKASHRSARMAKQTVAPTAARSSTVTCNSRTRFGLVAEETTPSQ